MKKTVSLILTILLVFCCVGITAAESNRVTLVIWSFTNELQSMIEKYYAPSHPEIDFEFQIYPTDGDAYTTKLDRVFSSATAAVSPEAPDVFALEISFVKKYTNSGYSASLKDLGFTDAELGKAYKVVADIGRDQSGVQKGLTWQSTPGALFYRASLAEKYLGVKSPEQMQEKVKDWDSLLNTARELKRTSESACKIITGSGDIWNAYQYARSEGWVVDEKLVVDNKLLAFEELCKALEKEDLTQKAGMWGETWFAGMRGELETLCYFLPTWGLRYTLMPNCVAGWDAENPNSAENIKNATENGTYGDWRMTAGPISYTWGGTYIEANTAKVSTANDTKKKAIKDLMYFFTLDSSFLTKYATETGDFVASAEAVNQILANGGMPNPFLGGQDSYAMFAQAAAQANGKLMTEYDEQLASLWEMYVTTPYTKGEKDLATCLAEFEAAVSDRLKILPSGITAERRTLVENFVDRCYRNILGRDASVEEKQYWAEMLIFGKISGSQLVFDFVNSEAFFNRDLSIEDQIEMLYQSMLNRPADPTGKTQWLAALNAGNPLSMLIKGICESSEYQSLCQQYGILPGSVTVESNELIRAFVSRCYKMILGRSPDREGLVSWTNMLANGSSTASQIILGFMSSEEYINKHLSDRESVRILYNAMLGREPDEGGWNGWSDLLAQGYPIGYIINGFSGSEEFIAICTRYGIKPGSVSVGPITPHSAVDLTKIKAFVTRCYQVILGREPDSTGLQGWSNALANGSATALQIINGFVTSEEYLNKNLSNRESIRILYNAMLGREPDEGGWNGWSDLLAKGYPLGYVINGFCGSDEFNSICSQYGITPGSIVIGPITPTPAKPIVNVEEAQALVTRCYVNLLGRDPDESGLAGWTNTLASGGATGASLVNCFVCSDEFISRKYSSEEIVSRLYRTMLKRDADSNGAAQWTAVLKEGYPIQQVINGISVSSEFHQVCAIIGIQPGAVNVPEVTPAFATPKYNEEKVRSYVQRLYRSVLGREADETGLNGYTGLIMNGARTPKQVAIEIIFSPEAAGRGIGDEQFIGILYNAFMGRDADPDGLAGWMEQLATGSSRGQIAEGFTNSNEFRTIVNEMKE